jgi:phytoene dehydrogenase-like protein
MSWDDAGAVVQQRAIDTLAQYAPAFKSSIRRMHTITPRDLNRLTA